jgi:hypothetical protein
LSGRRGDRVHTDEGQQQERNAAPVRGLFRRQWRRCGDLVE